MAAQVFKTIFIGYLVSKKGYKLYDPLTSAIHISRHVVFDETKFPFLQFSPSTPPFVPPSGSFGGEYETLVHEVDDTSHLSEIFNTDTTSPSDISIDTNTNKTSFGDTDTNDTSSGPASCDLPTVEITSQPPVRFYSRRKIQPAWFKDYDVSTNCVSTTSILQDCPITTVKYGFSLYSKIPSSVFSCTVNKQYVIKEPYRCNQAITDPCWVDAITKELNALESNNTWTVVPFPANKKVVGCRWVYRVKYLSNGDIDKFNARLVAKGYTQPAGEDYHSKITVSYCFI